MIRTLVRPLLLAVAVLATAFGGEDFTPLTFKGPGGELPYQMLAPAKVVAGTTYPLVIFLHGAGERGTNNTAQLSHCVRDFAKPEVRTKFPCFVIAPQCPSDRRWVEVDWGEEKPHTMPKEPSLPMGLLMALIPQFTKDHPVDKRRIYVSGLSMGGFGTWDLLARSPSTFAAAIPICGGADNSTAPAIAQIPVWVWHGGNDNIVKTVRSRSMVEALKAAGGKPIYNELPGVDHFSWGRAYAEPTLFDWLFAQQLPDPKKKKK